MEVDHFCAADGMVAQITSTLLMGLVIGYITVQCAIRMMAPQSIRGVYLPGVASILEQKGYRTRRWRWVTSDRPVKLVLAGFQRFYDKHHPKAERMKVAFGMDLAVRSQTVMRREGLGVRKFMDDRQRELSWVRLYTIMAVGIWFMLRRSEHIVAPGLKGKSNLLRRLVVFWDAGGSRIPYSDVGKRAAEKVTLNVTFAKTDQSGFGRRTSHVRQRGKESICVVCILEKWIALTRDVYKATEDMPLYDVPGFTSVDLRDLHTVMEATVRDLGVPGYGIKATSHSLRYGGATMMASAGFPQYLIAHYGGWNENSESLRQYTRPSDDSIKLVSEYMAQMTKRNPSMHYIQDLIVRQQAMGGKKRR
jgi:hypothetical protein